MEHFMEFSSQKGSEDLKFCEEREKGAAKIARDANAKGGFARLTAWHFDAKHPEYELCKKAVEEGKTKEHFHKQMVYYLQESQSATNQRRFQVAMGKAEVWGETMHFLFH
jgi:hypothetical protein